MAERAPATEGEARARTALVLGAVLLLALALRVAHVLAIRHDLLFQHPPLDEDLYVIQARALAAGHAPAGDAFWQPPGLAYLLAAITRVAGQSLLWPRLFQAGLSTATVWLVFRVGRRLWTPRLGLAAAALAAVHGVLVYQAGELLPATACGSFDLLAVELVLAARARPGPLRAAAAGLVLGVAACFSPLVLVFVPLSTLAVAGARPTRRAALLAAAHLAALALAIAPVTLHNRRVSGDTVLISTNGGLNFYLGNEPDYPRLFELRPGRHYQDLLAEPDAHGATRASTRSAYFYRRGLASVAAHPASAAARYGKKLWLFFHGAEIPRDTDVYAARDGSPVLRALVWPRPFCFPDALLLPLALVGLFACWRERARLWPLLGFFACQVAITCVFFVSARHRAPLLPVACLLAAAGAAWLARRWRAAAWSGRAALLAGGAAALTLACWPLAETRLSLRGELDFYRGQMLASRGRDLPAAIAAYRRALAAAPDDARYWSELGDLYERERDDDAAVDAWSHAAVADPWDVEPRRRAARRLSARGDDAGAARQLEANLAAAAREPAVYAHEHFDLGVIDVHAGRFAAALAKFTRAAALDPDYFRRYGAPWADSVMQAGQARDPGLWNGLAALFDELDQAPMATRARAYAEAPATPLP